MRVFLTIWISAVLIQEVIPGTLVRLPRHTPKRPALVQTEYEGKYEQKGQNGNENSGLFSGKHQIVHSNCAENWNDFADKCAALVKDLVASLANTVSSRPGDATKLQLQIKNTFKHFDSTHNLTCLNDKVNNNTKLDLSCLFNNLTISTIAPTMNNNKNSFGANNERKNKNCRNGQSHNGKNSKNGSDLREGVVGPGSNGDGDDGSGSSDCRENNIDTQYSHSAGGSTKPNNALDHAKNPGFNPENDEDSETGSNSRRQAEYPQVSWQPGNKTGHSHINHGKSNNISRSRYPYIVTPQPNSAYGSPEPATYSNGNNLPNGGNGFESDGQTNSNASPAGALGQSGTPSKSQTLPATNAYHSEPISDSLYKTGIPATGSHNSAYPMVTRVPSAFDDHDDATLVPTGPGGHSSKNGHALPKAPVTEDNYDPKPVPVKPMTDGLTNSQAGTIPSTEARDPKFSKNNSPKSPDSTKEPVLFLGASTDQTPEYPQPSNSHLPSKNHHSRPVAEIIQPVSSVAPEDSLLDSVSWTPSTKLVLTTDKPEGFSAQKDKKLGLPVTNSDSNIPEWRGPESQMGTSDPLPTGRNPNPPSAASVNHEPEHTSFAPTTNKFSDAITPPSDHVPPSVHVEPTLPEADNHKSEGPWDPGYILNNPSDQSAPVTIKPSFLPQNFDHLGGSSSENVDGKPKRGAPVTVHSVLVPTTMTPLSSNNDVKPEGNSGSNGNDSSGKSTTEEDDCEDDDAEEAGKTPTTVTQSSLQGSGIPHSNVEEGKRGVQNGISKSPVSGSESNTHPDSEDYEDCDENTDSDSATNAGTDNHATTAVVPPVHPVPKISDPIRGSLPVSDFGGENTGFSNYPNNVPHGSPSTGAGDHPHSVSPGGSKTGTANDATIPITASSVQPVPRPVVQEVQGNVPATDDYEDCDEYTESGTDVTTPVAVSKAQPVPKVSDPVVSAFDHGGENAVPNIDRNSVPVTISNTGTANDAIAPVSAVKPGAKKSDSVRGSPSVSDEGEITGTSKNPNSVPHDGSNTGSTTNPNSVPQGTSNAGIVNDAISSITSLPIQSLSTVPDPVEQENVAAPVDYEDCDENTESSNDAITPVPVSPVSLVPRVTDPAVQGNVPASDNDNESTGSSSDPNGASHISSGTGAIDYPNSVPVTSSNTGTNNQATGPVPESPVKPTQLDHAVQGNVPAYDDGEGSSSDPNGAFHGSSVTGTANQATSPVPVSPLKPVPKVSDPAVKGNVPDGGGNTGSSTYPNSVSHSSYNTGTASEATTPIAESVKPLSGSVPDPARQSLQSGDSPTSKTRSGIEGDQNGNSQSTPLNVTPSPHVYSPYGYTTISTSTEGQSHNPGNEDSALYKPTTFQTTATDPTSPQSILIPTESTRGLTKVPTPSHSSAGDDEDDEDEEDCCSCESCAEEITDPKQYKENACKNLEEARKELKAIFDKIKKKLKCGRKACNHTIGHISSGKETSVMT